MDKTQIWIYRQPRPRSKQGKERPAMIEIGNGIVRPNFYPYNVKNEMRVVACARALGYLEDWQSGDPLSANCRSHPRTAMGASRATSAPESGKSSGG